MPISEDFHGIERPEIEIYRFGKQQAIPFFKDALFWFAHFKLALLTLIGMRQG